MWLSCLVVIFSLHTEITYSHSELMAEVFAFCLMEKGYLAINAEIYTQTNDLVCKIDQNDILLNMATTGDFMCTVQGREIEISSLRNDAR